VAVDAQGNLYVADYQNFRILVFAAPLSSGMAATIVLGQADFTHSVVGSVSATSLVGPLGVAVDSQGNVYVADTFDNRVLKYNAPVSTHMAASLVFGQPDFTHGLINNNGLSASSLASPNKAIPDQLGNVYVSDAGNDRVLKYGGPLSNGMAANRVYGQPDFVSKVENNGGLSSQSLAGPVDVTLDAQGNLYVVDISNARVLGYGPASNPLSRFLWLPLVRR
jgi:hypothetical protein